MQGDLVQFELTYLIRQIQRDIITRVRLVTDLTHGVYHVSGATSCICNTLCGLLNCHINCRCGFLDAIDIVLELICDTRDILHHIIHILSGRLELSTYVYQTLEACHSCLIHEVQHVLCLCGQLLNCIDYFLRHLLDLCCSLSRILSQITDFIGNYCEASTLLSCTSCLYGRIQSQETGL